MPLRLYADECVNGRIIAGLRRHHLDVVTAEDAGLLRASDETQLAHATAETRAIITADRDFLILVETLLGRGGHFPGLMFISSHTTIGHAVHAIILAAQVLDPEDAADAIQWIP